MTLCCTHAGTGSDFVHVWQVSYVNALSGPCIATDTACSSSLVVLTLLDAPLELERPPQVSYRSKPCIVICEH